MFKRKRSNNAPQKNSKQPRTNTHPGPNAYRVFVNHLSRTQPTNLRSLSVPNDQLLHVRNQRFRVPFTNIRVGRNQRDPIHVKYPRVHPQNLNRRQLRASLRAVNTLSRNRLPKKALKQHNIQATQLLGEIKAFFQNFNNIWNRADLNWNSLTSNQVEKLMFAFPIAYEKLAKNVIANKNITNQQFVILATMLLRLYDSRIVHIPYNYNLITITRSLRQRLNRTIR